MFERIKICWYVLTKKEYFFAGVNNHISQKHGAVCYILSTDTKESHPFLSAVSDYAQQVIDKL